MKIIVDASLIVAKEKWFEFFPVYINNELDYNDANLRNKLLLNKNNQTSFYNFENLKTQAGKEEMIIFTIPKLLSGQHNAYQKLNHNPKILIVSGEALICGRQVVKQIITDNQKLETIAQKISNLNKRIKMHGLIHDLSVLPSKGRLQSIFSSILNKVGLKFMLKWENEKWTRDKIARNGWKILKHKIIQEKYKNLVFIVANKEDKYFKNLKAKCEQNFPNLKIKVEQMTNATIAHVGKSFITFYEELTNE